MDACILTTLNKHVDEMNATIQERRPNNSQQWAAYPNRKRRISGNARTGPKRGHQKP